MSILSQVSKLNIRLLGTIWLNLYTRTHRQIFKAGMQSN